MAKQGGTAGNLVPDRILVLSGIFYDIGNVFLADGQLIN